MASSRGEFQEHLLDLLWSLWEELGVPGTVPRRHRSVVIDPEPLVLFTALHGDLDPRLRDESIDWVVGHDSYLSKARIKRLLREWSVEADRSFTRYAATVNEHGGLGWPADEARPFTFRPRARAVLKDTAAAPLMALRIRAIFGVSARAELIRAFVSRPDAAFTATELAQEISYVRRQVVRALEALMFAGLVRSLRAGKNTRYLLARAEDVATIVAARPARSPRWNGIFLILHELLLLLERGARSGSVEASVGARRFIGEHELALEWAGIEEPVLPTGVAAWPALQSWAVQLAASFARPRGG